MLESGSNTNFHTKIRTPRRVIWTPIYAIISAVNVLALPRLRTMPINITIRRDSINLLDPMDWNVVSSQNHKMYVISPPPRHFTSHRDHYGSALQTGSRKHHISVDLSETHSIHNGVKRRGELVELDRPTEVMLPCLLLLDSVPRGLACWNCSKAGSRLSSHWRTGS